MAWYNSDNTRKVWKTLIAGVVLYGLNKIDDTFIDEHDVSSPGFGDANDFHVGLGENHSQSSVHVNLDGTGVDNNGHNLTREETRTKIAESMGYRKVRDNLFMKNDTDLIKITYDAAVSGDSLVYGVPSGYNFPEDLTNILGFKPLGASELRVDLDWSGTSVGLKYTFEDDTNNVTLNETDYLKVKDFLEDDIPDTGARLTEELMFRAVGDIFAKELRDYVSETYNVSADNLPISTLLDYVPEANGTPEQRAEDMDYLFSTALYTYLAGQDMQDMDMANLIDSLYNSIDLEELQSWTSQKLYNEYVSGTTPNWVGLDEVLDNMRTYPIEFPYKYVNADAHQNLITALANDGSVNNTVAYILLMEANENGQDSLYIDTPEDGAAYVSYKNGGIVTYVPLTQEDFDAIYTGINSHE